MEIPFLLDQQNHHIKVDVSTDGTIQGLHANRVDEDNDEKKRDRDGKRIYIKVDWEWSDKGLDEKIAPEEVCLKFGYSSSPVKCFMVPQTDPLFINQNANEGSHILYFTDKSGEQILAVTTFQVVVPTVDLIDIFTSKAEGSDSEHLMATIRTTLFDPFDPAFRVCVLLDDSLGCLDPEWMAVDERELRHATHKEPLHQSVTFRSPLDHVPFNHGNGHEISVLLLTANNKAVHLTTTLAFNAASTVNPLEGTSILHILDPRIHTPQRPRSCPDSMRSTPNLRWICELWRHEWGIYSQNGEDGILSKIFHHIGTKDKSYVEFGTESGQECNTRLLRQIHGWKGLLMDSRYEEESIELHREFITRENFMPLLTEKYQHLVPPDLDLLSIDVDFNDFWLLSAVDLTRVAPRVVVVEVNSHIPSSEARTVQYDDSDDGSGGWDGLSAYFGGSVAAFHRWGARNGYSLVYCESHGVNCFLVRNDALGGVNVSAVLGPDQLQNPPNFFGQGWNYPDMWKPHHKWVWI
ncbi:Conserved secreted protein [Phytophthora megakarya]|uniref:Conserved secreted protein n=1 Tax=Phytophthora megakarya TaxID=4795 RepID=A0A225WZN9_9STRA|nr:Conserved secreted protein [Phytophthora megakarya]